MSTKNKERCQRYKAAGRREINKELKKERHENRLKRFKEKMQRRAVAGKKYVYDKERTAAKRKNHIEIKTTSIKTEFQKWESAFRKVQNQLDKIEKEAKEEKRAN